MKVPFGIPKGADVRTADFDANALRALPNEKSRNPTITPQSSFATGEALHYDVANFNSSPQPGDAMSVSRFLLTGLTAASLCLAAGMPARAEDRPETVAALDLPARDPVPIKVVGTLGPGARLECSGIVKSLNTDDLYWTIGDSGNPPRIYPVRADGTLWKQPSPNAPPGVLVRGARNIDWEDIATDGRGHLIIADVGNNANAREDLTLYVLAEPAPDAVETPLLKTLRVTFPDQRAFPSPSDDFNFDCEALFAVDGVLHLLTKHRSDTFTKLYRLDEPTSDKPKALTLLGRFDARGLVTGAESSADGKQLAVLTYNGVWLFERERADQEFFAGRIRWAPLVSPQMESITFRDSDTLLVADEMLATLFEIKAADLTEVRPLPAEARSE